MKEIRNVHWLMKHAKKYTIFFITSEASLVVGYVISFLLPRNIKIIIDSIIINKSYDLIPNVAISYIALLAINIVFKFIYQYSWQKLYNGFVVDIKKEAFSAVLHAKANSKLCENTGDMMCRIEYDCDQLIHMITKNVFHFTNSLALCFVITLIIGKHSIYMAIFVVVAAMFPALITSCFKKQNEACSQEHKKTYGFFTGFLLEVFDHIWQIKLLGSGNTIKSKIEKTLQKFIRLGNRMKRIDITVEKIIYALNLSTSIVVYCVSIYLIYSQRMSVGEFVSIVMYIALLHKKLNWVLRIWLDWSSRKISINRVCELLNVDRDTYYGVFGSKTSVKYTPLLSGVKEDIILEEYTGTDSFSFLLTTNGYSVIQSFGKYYLSDPLTGEICGSFGDVIIYDAAGNTATGCMTLKAIETDNKYILTIHADRSFLTSETTQYPVTIDPTFEMTNNLTAANILDATVYSTETSGYHGGSTTLKVGIDSQLGAGRMYFRFPTILNNYAVTNQYYNVTRVELYLYNNSANTTENTLLIHKHAGEGNWTEVEATCLNIGYHDIGTTLGSTVVSATNQYYSFDITEAFNSWKTNSDEFAKGIMIRAQNLSSAEYAKTFASTESDTNKPYVVFTYTDLTPMVCMYHGNLVLECGETYTAKATLWIGDNIVPSTGQITFNSSKTDIATIDSSSGLILAKNPGTTIITARYNDTNISCQITLSVTQTTSGEDETAYISLPVRTITLNNDSNRNSDRSYTISPEFHYNDSVVEATFTYTAQLVDSLYDDFYPVHVGVSTDGVIKINPAYSDSMEMAHPTGSFTVGIYGEAKVNGTTVVATTTLLVNVICEDMPLPGYSSTNPLVGGRYVKILNDVNFDNGALFNDLMDEWQLSCDKRYVNFTAQGSDYIELDGQNFDITFFEMMRSSKIFVITTHGTSTSISVSGIDENLKITCDQRFPNGYQGASSQPNKNDILTLHNGYFGYCDLVIYTLCNGASIYDNDCNLMEITHMKGAKTVVGFKTEVGIEEAGKFQDALFKYLMPEFVEVEENIETHCNSTIEDAVSYACSESGVSSTIVKISGDATIKIREYMEESQ
ncbi:MAG: DNRLRE domain-containing protein [Clostridia bacterium]|nr:DNRLRE domain-containing protein [Clostridia bacterium]